MIKKTIEILSECSSYSNLRKGIQLFLSKEDAPPTLNSHPTMAHEARALRKISELLRSDTTLLATYEYNSRMYFGARIAHRQGMVYFATTWAGVDAFLKSKKTLRQLIAESVDVWVDTVPSLDATQRLAVAQQIEFVDVLYRDVPTKLRINIL